MKYEERVKPTIHVGLTVYPIVTGQNKKHNANGPRIIRLIEGDRYFLQTTNAKRMGLSAVNLTRLAYNYTWEGKPVMKEVYAAKPEAKKNGKVEVRGTFDTGHGYRLPNYLGPLSRHMNALEMRIKSIEEGLGIKS